MITDQQLIYGIIMQFKSYEKVTVKSINSIINYMLMYRNFRLFVDQNRIDLDSSNVSIDIIDLLKKLDCKYRKNVLYILEKAKNIISNNKRKIIVESYEELTKENKTLISSLLFNNSVNIENIEYVTNTNHNLDNNILVIKMGNFIVKLSLLNFIMQNIQDKKSLNFWQFVYEQ